MLEVSWLLDLLRQRSRVIHERRDGHRGAYRRVATAAGTSRSSASVPERRPSRESRCAASDAAPMPIDAGRQDLVVAALPPVVREDLDLAVAGEALRLDPA